MKEPRRLRVHSIRPMEDSTRSINWWRGALRPFESLRSFAARFCVLNGIDIKEFENFFGIQAAEQRQLCDGDLCKIASILGEDLDFIKSTFLPLIKADDSLADRRLRSLQKHWGIQYCRQCVRLGYHSYFHEIPWLRRCPFHFCELDYESHGSVISGRLIRFRGIDTIIRLMMSNCRFWPRWNDGDRAATVFRHNPYVRLLSDWLVNVRTSAQKKVSGRIWLSDGQIELQEGSYEHFMARLKSLEKVPSLLEDLFQTNKIKWHFTTYRYPSGTRKELLRAIKYAPLQMIFYLYKCVCAYSGRPQDFVMRLSSAQAMLREMHGECHCTWGWEQARWSGHWVKVNSRGLPHWGYKCPYECALEELELGWGHPNRVLSARKAWQAEADFINQTPLLKDAGLINYTTDAVVLANGYLAVAPQNWPCCEWNEESPLTTLLSTAAGCEIEVTARRIFTWLNAIDRGEKPYGQDLSMGVVQIRDTGTGLSLTQWGP